MKISGHAQLMALVLCVLIFPTSLHAGGWTFEVGEEDWGPTCSVNTTLIDGPRVSILSAKGDYDPVLVIDVSTGEPGDEFQVKLQLDNGAERTLPGAMDEYFSATSVRLDAIAIDNMIRSKVLSLTLKNDKRYIMDLAGAEGVLKSFKTCAATSDPTSKNAAASKNEPEFVFGLDNVCSVKNEKACLVLGSPWNAPAIKKAMPGYEVAYSDECEGFCFLVTSDDGTLEVLQDAGKVSFFRSLHGSMDFKGNVMGDQLNRAIGGSEAFCQSGLNFVCSSERSAPLRYVVGGCEFEIKGEEDEAVRIPDCATIDGFELSGNWESSGDPTDSSTTPSTAASPEFLALPNDVQAYVSQVRNSCKEVYAEVDYDVSPIPEDDMQGIIRIEIEGKPAIIAENENLCTDIIPAGNCTNRTCGLAIWRQGDEGSWHKIFHENLYGRELKIDRSNHFRSMDIGIHAEDPRCQPEQGKEYYSRDSCSLVVNFKNGHWNYQLFKEHRSRAIEGADLNILKGASELDCRLHCAENALCKGYSYDLWNSYCFLKSEIRPLRRDPRYVTAARPEIQTRESRQRHSISKRPNKRFRNSPYKSGRAANFEACGRHCIADNHCDAISFENAARVCHLLSEPEEFFDQRGSDIGIRLQEP